MYTSLIALLATALAVLSPALPAYGYQVTGRWSSTATNSSTGPRGTPITVTWSIVPDGTPVNQGGNSNGSNLVAFLDNLFNVTPGQATGDFRNRPWFFIFQDSFNRLSELAGVTYLYEPNDDGVITNTAGRLGVRGDVRITGKSLGASSTSLAVNFFPNHSDMVINTDKTSFFRGSSNNYRGFRNVVMHEALHGLGITHVESTDGDFLMAPVIQTHFDGPQIDEILGMHRNYGDRLEKGGNDSPSDVTALPSLAVGGTYQLGQYGASTIVAADQIDFVSIDGSSDVDYYRFNLLGESRLSLSLTPRGPSYMQGPQGGTQTLFHAGMQSDLSLTLFAGDGVTQLELANLNGLGGSEHIAKIASPGTYVVRVVGDRDQTQLYGLQFAAAPAVNDVVWTGAKSNDWELHATPNFAAEGVATPFLSGDRVRFIDNFAPKIVDLNADVNPESVTIDTAGRYIIQGPGAIVTGSLSIDGVGEVELANSGNRYQGTTSVNKGRLLISGDANDMVSPITIAAGASLTMDASDASGMGSTFNIEPSGTLQIGRATSNGNVFPDRPAAVVNNGTIEIYDDEVLANVSGAGNIVVRQETATFGDGNTFTGTIAIRSGGAIAGSTTLQGHVSVESGGILQPGAGVGLLTAGGLTLAPQATTAIELAGRESGAFDQFVAVGEALLDGALKISLVDEFVPILGDVFEVISAQQLSGGFSSFDLPILSSGLIWAVAYDESSVKVSVAATHSGADFDLNGAVNGDDLSIWSTHFGLAEIATHAHGDADGNGNVDGADFLAWQRHYNASPAASSAMVPEPAAAAMLAATICCFPAARKSISRGASSFGRIRQRLVAQETFLTT